MNEDGFVIMYCKDGTIYPLALTNTQDILIQHLIAVALDHKVVLDTKSPIGKAINLLEPNHEAPCKS